MTREEFKEKAQNLIDSYQFSILGDLFEYDNFEEEMRVAYIPGAMDTTEADMPLVEFLDDLYEQIKGVLSPVTPTQKWIPVSERLPENDEVVLGTNSSNDLFETYTWDDCGEIKWYANGCFDVPIVAWMPFPEPYKAEMESEE